MGHVNARSEDVIIYYPRIGSSAETDVSIDTDDEHYKVDPSSIPDLPQVPPIKASKSADGTNMRTKKPANINEERDNPPDDSATQHREIKKAAKEADEGGDGDDEEEEDDSSSEEEDDSSSDEEEDSFSEEEDDSSSEEEGDEDAEGDAEGDEDAEGDAEGEGEGEGEEGDSSDGLWEGQAEADLQVDVRVDAQGDAQGNAQVDAQGDAQGDVQGDAQGDVQGDAQGDAPVDMQVDAQVEEAAEEEAEAQKGGAMKKRHSLRPPVQSDGEMDKLRNYQGSPSASPIVAPMPMEEDTSDDHGLSLLHISTQQSLPRSLKRAAEHSPPSPGAQFTHLLSELTSRYQQIDTAHRHLFAIQAFRREK